MSKQNESKIRKNLDSNDIWHFTGNEEFLSDSLFSDLNVFISQRNQDENIELYNRLRNSFRETATKQERRRPRLEEQFLSLSSEFQDLKNKVNKYFKIEIREEATSQFAEMISAIDNIKEVYVYHEANKMIFWIFYDSGERVELIEKIVDVECDFEGLFPKINFDYQILPFSKMNYHIASQSDLIYKRG